MAASSDEERTWVIVVSHEHARRGVADGFIMANHGKRAPLARMSRRRPHPDLLTEDDVPGR